MASFDLKLGVEAKTWRFSTSCFAYGREKIFITDLDELRSLDAKFIAVTLQTWAP